jgi:hypothetical protein
VDFPDNLITLNQRHPEICGFFLFKEVEHVGTKKEPFVQ